jgi:flagellar biogenesis protein FliO
LVEAAGHWLLVGSSPGRVNTLLTLEHPPSFASVQNRTQSEKDQNNSPTENVAN